MLIGPLAAYNASTGLIFAKVKSHDAEFTPDEAREVGALLRLMISLAWVLVPGAVGVSLAGRPSLLPAFLVAALLAFVGFAVLAVGLPPDRARAAGAPAPGSPTSRAFADPGLILRVAGIALATLGPPRQRRRPAADRHRPGRRHGDDVGVIVGYVALLEVVFIFVWATVARRLAMPVALAASLGLYLGYLLPLGTAQGMPQVHAASVLGGIAAAAIITLPIPYLLGLIAGRPGLSAWLMAVNQFLGAGIGAALFAGGTALGGYPAAAVLAGVAGLLGGGLVLALDGRTAHGATMTRVLLEVCIDEPEGLPPPAPGAPTGWSFAPPSASAASPLRRPWWPRPPAPGSRRSR